MTMNDLVKQCRCKYAKWARRNPESTTAWLECKLKETVINVSDCATCAEREPKGVHNEVQKLF